MAKHYPLDIATLPFNDELIALLKERRDSGAELILATAAPEAWARAVAEHVGIFTRVLATDQTSGNLKGKRKLARILSDANGQPFAYAGDAHADLPIFEAAALPIVIGRSAGLAGRNESKAIVLPPPR
jgi:phosphoserine phosphatase